LNNIPIKYNRTQKPLSSPDSFPLSERLGVEPADADFYREKAHGMAVSVGGSAADCPTPVPKQIVFFQRFNNGVFIGTGCYKLAPNLSHVVKLRQNGFSRGGEAERRARL
jgi:hypothetical protein